MTSSSSEAFLELCEGAPTESFKSGDTLMKQGDEGGFCFIVQSGSVAIEFERADGLKEQIASRGIGELIGELSLFQKLRSATVIAITDCRCARVSHAALLTLITAQPTVALALLSASMRKVRERHRI
jgi:CRP/FNR family transcriptional regulator, cyclic AMP receptor protein